MNFEISNINQCKDFLENIKSIDNLYLADKDGEITTITREQFFELDNTEKAAIYDDLENVIAMFDDVDSAKYNSGALNKIRLLRNAIFYSLNPSLEGQTGITDIPKDVLETLIIPETSPNDTEALKLVNKWFNKVATRIQIDLINKENLSLEEILPFKNATKAINWLIQDKEACQRVRFADLRGFDRIMEKDIALLVKHCPNIQYLFIKSDIIQKIEALPKFLQTFNCNGCEALQSLPALPDSIGTFECSQCWVLAPPSNLPESLRLFACNNCPRFTKLPKLPESLEIISCRGCIELKLPDVPEDVEVRR